MVIHIKGYSPKMLKSGSVHIYPVEIRTDVIVGKYLPIVLPHDDVRSRFFQFEYFYRIPIPIVYFYPARDEIYPADRHIEPGMDY